VNKIRKAFTLTGIIPALIFVTAAWVTADSSSTSIISLQRVNGDGPLMHITEGKPVRLQNDMTRVLYNTSILRVDSEKNILQLATFHPGQSVNLEFSRKGEYQVCYEWVAETAPEMLSSCLRLNVVALQTA